MAISRGFLKAIYVKGNFGVNFKGNFKGKEVSSRSPHNNWLRRDEGERKNKNAPTRFFFLSPQLRTQPDAPKGNTIVKRCMAPPGWLGGEGEKRGKIKNKKHLSLLTSFLLGWFKAFC